MARIDFKLRMQMDARESDVAFDAGESSVDWPRKRFGVEGEVAGVLGFQVEREFDDLDPWRDVFVNYQQFDEVQVQAGKFKIPFSMDMTTGPGNLDFIYRSSAAVLLAPGRDRGVMVHGRVIKRLLGYEVGVFEHDGLNARRPGNERVFGGQAVAVRVTARPFRLLDSFMRTFEVGLATMRSEVPEGLPSFEGETALGHRFYDPRVLVLGPQRRRGFEFRWRPGPFSVKSEYIRMTIERQGESVENTDLPPFLGTGWYVSGTWAVTGEAKADGLDNPRRPITRGGPGAIEAVVRLEGTEFSSVAKGDLPSTSPRADVILGNRLRATTFGVNWYPMRWVRLQFNVIRESLVDPAQGPLPAQSAFWSRVLSLQFAF